MEGSTVCLSDLCELVADPVDPATRPADLYLGLEHLTSGRLVPTGAGQASDVRSSKSSFQPGDVLYGKLRPYLDKAVLVDKEGICTTELLVLRAKSGVEPRFLAAVVHSPAFVHYAIAGTKGVQHPRTSWAHIREFNMPEFTSDEQRRMAALLWAVHDAVMASEALIASGQDLKRTTMQTLFTRGLRGEAQKETEIGPVPASWEVGQLGQFADVISTRMTYSELDNLHSSVCEDSIRVLGIKVADMNLPGNEVELYTAALDKMVDIETVKRRCAPPGIIIFPKRGAAIATNKKRLSTEWTAFDPNVIGVVAGTKINKIFLFQWFQTFDLRTITDMGPTPQLNKKNLLPLNIPVPSSAGEQDEIVAVLDAIDDKIDLHRRKGVVLKELFRALLHKLMTGEIRVGELIFRLYILSTPTGHPNH